MNTNRYMKESCNVDKGMNNFIFIPSLCRIFVQSFICERKLCMQYGQPV